MDSIGIIYQMRSLQQDLIWGFGGVIGMQVVSLIVFILHFKRNP